MAGEIVQKLVDNQITNRNINDVRAKISTLENGFRKASDWLVNTGNFI